MLSPGQQSVDMCGKVSEVSLLCVCAISTVWNCLCNYCYVLLNLGSALMWLTVKHPLLSVKVEDSSSTSGIPPLNNHRCSGRRGISLKNQRGNITTTNVFSWRKKIRLWALLRVWKLRSLNLEREKTWKNTHTSQQYAFIHNSHKCLDVGF